MVVLFNMVFRETNPNIQHLLEVDSKGNPLPNPTETPIPDIIIIEPEEVGDDNRIDLPNPDLSETPKLFPTVQINVTNFTDIKYEGDFGGAIHIVNYGFEISKTKFSNCTSEKAGGGIYIKNNLTNINKKIDLKGLTFSECGAVYGGAVYIYSVSRKSKIEIKNCIFTNNKASNDKSLPLFGGSSIFMTARKGKVIECSMNDNEGTDLKLYNYFDEVSNELSLLNHGDESIIISNCKFETNDAKSSSLLYLGGSNGVPIEMKDCSFTGKLRIGSHYIDGKILNENSHKLVVKKCLFDDNKVNSINLVDNQKSVMNIKKIDNQNNYISIDFNDQTFNDKKYISSIKFDANKNDTKKSFGIVFLTSVFAVGIIVTALIVFVLKKISHRDSSDDNDEQLNEILNQNDF